jgi:hypothetical protein
MRLARKVHGLFGLPDVVDRPACGGLLAPEKQFPRRSVCARRELLGDRFVIGRGRTVLLDNRRGDCHLSSIPQVGPARRQAPDPGSERHSIGSGVVAATEIPPGPS